MNPDITNRTIFVGDNLPVLRRIDSESVDLVYLDPPFNSNRNYFATVVDEETQKKVRKDAFEDVWTMDEHDEAYMLDSYYTDRKLYNVINAVGDALGEPSKAFTVFMAMRLVEMHRVLKPTGSLFLHVDHHMAHSLKLVLDVIFKPSNFINEIVWFYPDTPGRSRTSFPKKHDNILFYAKGKDYKFNREAVLVPLKPESIERYKSPRTIGGRTYEGGDTSGKLPETVWQLPAVKRNSKESAGYDTQKPLKLLNRIIRATTDPGDWVLDPFCGCATTCVSAQFLQRKWIGIDIGALAFRLVEDRIDRLHGDSKAQADLEFRGDVDASQNAKKREDLPNRSDVVKSKDIKRMRYREQNGRCAACKEQFEFKYMEKDHILAKSRGGVDADYNIQVLCRECNGKKKDKPMRFLLELLAREEIEKNSEWLEWRRNAPTDKAK